MKKITLLLILLTVSFGYAQTSPITFDADVTVGANWNNATGIATSIVDVDDATIGGPGAPVAGLAAPAGMVGKMITDAGSDPWQEAHLIMTTSAVDLTTATGGTKTVTVDVYSTTGNDFLLKVIDPVGGGGAFSQVPAAHDGTGWEQLTFDFTVATSGGVPDAEFETLVFFPLYDAVLVDFISPSTMTTTAIDNVTFVEGSAIVLPNCMDGVQNQDETGIDCGGATCPTCPPTCDDGIQNQDETGVDCGGALCDACIAPPTDAPPTPPARDPLDVLSIYGEAYGTAVGLANVGWNASTFTEENIASNNVLKIDFLDPNFIGTSLGSVQDATDMTHFHMDYYVADVFAPGQVFNPKWSNHAMNMGETNAGELTVALGPTDVQNWISVDVPLTNFSAGISPRANLTEFLISVSGTIDLAYIDNIYFHKNTTLGTDDFATSEFKVYPNPTNTEWNIKTNGQDITSVQVFDILGKNVMSVTPNSDSVQLDTTTLPAGLYFAKLTSETGTKSVKLIKQ